VARNSLWTRLKAAEARSPGVDLNPVTVIIRTILGTGEGGKDRISGISYRACTGYEHPLDCQSIDFGEHGIPRDEVPSPWRELLDGSVEPFTFNLDSPDQDSPSATDTKV
jgi:hypothetical protein